MTTATKTITFENVMKTFKNFVASKDHHKEVIRLVYFDGSHFYATDSHRLIKLNSTYVTDIPRTEPFFYNPKTNEMIDVSNYNYPDINRLFPKHHNTLVKLNKNDLKEIEESIKEVKKLILTNSKKLILTLNFTSNHTDLKVDDYGYDVLNEEDKKLYDECKPNEITLDNIYVHEGENSKVLLNNQFLTQSITAMKKLGKLSSEDIELKMIGGLRPVVFSQSDIFDIMIMPMRKY